MPRMISEDQVLAIILETMSDVFEVQVIDADNFFDLGGDSMTAVQLGDELEERFHTELDLDILLNTDNMRALAKAVVESLGEDDANQ